MAINYEQAIAKGKPNPRYSATGSKNYGNFLRSLSPEELKAYKKGGMVVDRTIPTPEPIKQEPQKVLEPSLPPVTPAIFYEQGQFNLQSVPVQQSFAIAEHKRLASMRVSEREKIPIFRQYTTEKNKSITQYGIEKRKPLLSESSVPTQYAKKYPYSNRSELVNKISLGEQPKTKIEKAFFRAEQDIKTLKKQKNQGKISKLKYYGSSALIGLGYGSTTVITGLYDTVKNPVTLLAPLYDPIGTEKAVRSGITKTISEIKYNPVFGLSKLGAEVVGAYATGKVLQTGAKKLGIKPLREKILDDEITARGTGQASLKLKQYLKIEDRPVFKKNDLGESIGVLKSSKLGKGRLDKSIKLKVEPTNIYYGTENIFKTKKVLSLPETRKIASARTISTPEFNYQTYTQQVDLFPVGKKTIDVAKKTTSKQTNIILSSKESIGDILTDTNPYFETLKFKTKPSTIGILELLKGKSEKIESSQINKGSYGAYFEKESRAITPNRYIKSRIVSGSTQKVRTTSQGNVFKEYGLVDNKPSIIKQDIELTPARVKFVKGITEKEFDTIKMQGYTTQELIKPYSKEVISQRKYAMYESAYGLQGKTNIPKPEPIRPQFKPKSRITSDLELFYSKESVKNSLLNLKKSTQNMNRQFTDFDLDLGTLGVNQRAGLLQLPTQQKKVLATKKIQKVDPQRITMSDLTPSFQNPEYSFNLPSTMNKPVFNLGLTTKPDTIQRQNNNIALKPIQEIKQFQVQKPIQVFKSIQVQKPIQEETRINVQIPKRINKQISIQKQIQVQKPMQILKTVQIQTPISITTPIKIPVPRTPKPNIPKSPIPVFNLPRERINTKKLFSFGAYKLEYKRKGKFKTIASGLTKGEALKLGQLKTDITTSRTFRIKPQGITQRQKNGFVDITRYRRSKKNPYTFIEKTKFAISTGGEKKELKQAKRMWF